ncbi:hypothetical protein ABZV67_43475 [Streptomyces sp. NPDC005065]|uniref:hypothetical protein n=1 Tax=Streptomyces sp. NPDC005065 TaxID=3154461 RepID=UPI0033AD03FC
MSFTQNDYLNKSTSEDIAQEIDAYRGTPTASVMKDLEKPSPHARPSPTPRRRPR